jgi:hypothetical protein
VSEFEEMAFMRGFRAFDVISDEPTALAFLSFLSCFVWFMWARIKRRGGKRAFRKKKG